MAGFGLAFGILGTRRSAGTTQHRFDRFLCVLYILLLVVVLTLWIGHGRANIFNAIFRVALVGIVAPVAI